MSVLGNLFGATYEDDKLAMEAERVIAQDPIMNNPGAVGVFSEEGVVTLTGSVNSEREKRHLEDRVRTALDNSGLSYDRVENNLDIP